MQKVCVHTLSVSIFLLNKNYASDDDIEVYLHTLFLAHFPPNGNLKQLTYLLFHFTLIHRVVSIGVQGFEPWFPISQSNTLSTMPHWLSGLPLLRRRTISLCCSGEKNGNLTFCQMPIYSPQNKYSFPLRLNIHFPWELMKSKA